VEGLVKNDSVGAMFEQALISAAQTIIDGASGGDVSRIQFDSARYVLEWCLGGPQRGGSFDPMGELLDRLKDEGPKEQ
jgi:hypothetical protein